jgi:membrane-associated protease RseP (regulator of RpoE activity)
VLAADVGQRLTLTVERGKQALALEVETRDDRDMGPLDLELPTGATVWGGMVVAPLTEDHAAHFGTPSPEEGPGGLIVLAVAPASPGAAAGMMPGDILVDVQGQEIDSVEGLWKASGRRRSATVSFWRNGGRSVAVLGGLERR